MGILIVAGLATGVGFLLILFIGRGQPVSPASPENLAREGHGELSWVRGYGIEGFQLEPLFPIDAAKRKPGTKRGRRRNAPPGTEKLTGRSRVIEESGATQSAAQAAKAMGWQLREGANKKPSVSLHRFASASANPTSPPTPDAAPWLRP